MEKSEKEEKLLEKCKKEIAKDPSVTGACRVMLETMEKKGVKVSKAPPEQTYLEMAENLEPEDVRLILKMALKVRESGDVKDPEVKIAASRLIRAIEMF